MHWTPWALSLARVRDGSSSAARIAMMAMTTSSSMRVKPREGHESCPVDNRVLFIFMRAWFVANDHALFCHAAPPIASIKCGRTTKRRAASSSVQAMPARGFTVHGHFRIRSSGLSDKTDTFPAVEVIFLHPISRGRLPLGPPFGPQLFEGVGEAPKDPQEIGRA